jgi:predicted nucleotidyltransferase
MTRRRIGDPEHQQRGSRQSKLTGELFMGMAILPPDFKDFLRLLHLNRIEYLLIGGYAVGYYGYPRATADMDIWIAVSEKNAKKMAEALKAFGMGSSQLNERIFLKAGKMIRMGHPPIRIEIFTEASGVKFAQCYKRRKEVKIDGIKVKMISLEDLKKNKRASGRHKDLSDLENLK